MPDFFDFDNYDFHKKNYDPNKIRFSNSKSYILRENDIIDYIDSRENLFLDYEYEEDREGKYLEFSFLDKYKNVSIYNFDQSAIFLLFNDNKKMFITIDDYCSYFTYKNTIIFY